MRLGDLLTQLNTFLRKPVALVLLLSIHTILNIWGSVYKDPMGDEFGYYSYAKRWLHGQYERTDPFDDSKTPTVLPALAYRGISQIINPELKKTDGGNSDIKNGRLTFLVFSLLLFVYLWLFLRKLNFSLSLLPLLLYTIDPLILAYSTTIVSDLPCGFFSLAFLYHIFLLISEKKSLHIIPAGIYAGLALTTKFSFLPIFFATAIVLLFYAFTTNNKKRFIRTYVKGLTIISLLVILVINLAYPGDRIFPKLSDNANKSEKFQYLEQTWLGGVPIPVPLNVIQAADMLSYHAQPDSKEITFSGGTYLFNEFYYHEGPIWYYYFVLLFFKMPIFSILLLCLGILFTFYSFRQEPIGFSCSIIILIFLFFAGLSNTFQIGARHLLAIYPLFFIIFAYALKIMAEKTGQAWLSIIFLLGIVYTSVSFARYSPHFLAYTNEFISDKKIAHWKLGEGVNDYGQADNYVKKFRQNNPEFQALPLATDTLKGKYAVTSIDLFFYAFRYKNPQALKLWNTRPVAIERFVILLYEFP